jgi:hypothetical protein
LSGSRTKRPAAGQLVIAATVASANGKLRATGREKSVVSIRLKTATLADLDVMVERDRGGRSYVYPPVSRTTLIEQGIALLFAARKAAKK